MLSYDNFIVSYLLALIFLCPYTKKLRPKSQLLSALVEY